MSTKSKRILLLDDDYFSMEAVKTYLEVAENFCVELTAQEDILARLAHERFDIICIDVMIQSESPNAEDELVKNIQYPDVKWQRTGLEFLHRLRAGAYAAPNGGGTPSNVPVIVLSAIADVHINSGLNTAQSKPELPHTRYIEKPFDTEKFIETLHMLLLE